MQMEDFYAAEKDADILIYNGTIEGELTSIAELVQKNSLFADFKDSKIRTGLHNRKQFLPADQWNL